MRNRISVFFALAGLVAVLLSGAYRVAVSADSEPYEMLTPTMMPAPDTLLVNDDGALIFIPMMDAIDRYWASLFVPGSLCSLKAAMIGTFPMGTTWPDCSLFVWNDDPMNQRPLEPPVFWTTFTVANGFPFWDSIIVNPSFVTSDAFWIGYWMPNIGPDPMEQDLPGCDVSPPPPGLPSSVSQNRVFWQPVPAAYPSFFHLGIRAVVSFFVLQRHDVEPTQILGVPDTVFCGDSLTVEVEVYNAGEALETFDVAIEFDTLGTVFYADTEQVTDLIPDGTTIVTFVPDVGIPWSDSTNYGILAHTMLVGDDSTANDSLTGTTFGYCLWVDDVGPLALTSPGDSVWCDSTVDVEATVFNYGNRARTFDFKILIDDSLGGNVYAESVTVLDLLPLTPDSATFPPWTVPPTDSMEYTVRMITLLAGDMNAANDTVSDFVYSRCFLIRDVGALSVVVPGDTVYCDSTYTPEAQVRNFGDFTETFAVEFLIDGGVTYGDTSVVPPLGPGLTTNVTFTNWVVPQVDSVAYDISVATILAPDMNPANDAIADSTYGVCLWMRDVGALSVVVPGDTVYCDTAYTPEAEVQNFGELAEDFAVEFLIDGGATYGDTSVVMGLGPGLDTNVTFTNWVVPQVDSVTYDISVATIFAQDMNTANDSVAGSTFGICLWFRDVTPITIVWPGDTVVCGDTADVVAQVRNDGEIAETFSVEAVIETLGLVIYAETTAVGPVAPGETTDAVFPSWGVPQRDFLTYDLAVVTLLGLDALPANDTLTGATYGLCPFHDGGVVSIDSPPDTVDVDSTYTPLAAVHNYGNRLETFDVVCTIDGYTDTSQVTDLMPDSSYQVSFTPDWSAPAVGQYTMCVTSYVLADGNAANDSLCKTIESITGVEEVRLLSPAPLRTQVFQNSPNPFSGRTVIEYAVSKEARVDLSIYDASGRLVKYLVQEDRLPGYYTAIWDGKDEYGSSVPSGIYFYKLVCGKTVESRKMVMVK